MSEIELFRIRSRGRFSQYSRKKPNNQNALQLLHHNNNLYYIGSTNTRSLLCRPLKGHIYAFLEYIFFVSKYLILFVFFFRKLYNILYYIIRKIVMSPTIRTNDAISTWIYDTKRTNWASPIGHQLKRSFTYTRRLC